MSAKEYALYCGCLTTKTQFALSKFNSQRHRRKVQCIAIKTDCRSCNSNSNIVNCTSQSGAPDYFFEFNCNNDAIGSSAIVLRPPPVFCRAGPFTRQWRAFGG